MGSKIAYYIFIKPISWLPYPLLYLFSDFVFLIIYYLVGYRKKVVGDNLKKVFPKKSDTERKAIQKKFYRHLCDLIVEAFKGFSISQEKAAKRLVQSNPELPNSFFEKGKGICFAGGHYCNWELWAIAAPLKLRHQLLGIYKQIKDPFFDRKMRESRSKFGMEMVRTKDFGARMKTVNPAKAAPVFAVDQSPANPDKSYWTNFLDIETACYYGIEKYAKEFDLPVIYGRLKKVKRGHYEVEYELLSEFPNSEPYGAIVEKATRAVEKDVLTKPEYWLWSHKRWKHKKK